MSKICRGLSQTIDLSTSLILTASKTTKIILVPRKYVAYGTSHLRSIVKDIANILVVLRYFRKFPKPGNYPFKKSSIGKHLLRDISIESG